LSEGRGNERSREIGGGETNPGFHEKDRGGGKGRAGRGGTGGDRGGRRRVRPDSALSTGRGSFLLKAGGAVHTKQVARLNKKKKGRIYGGSSVLILLNALLTKGKGHDTTASEKIQKEKKQRANSTK